MVCSSAPRTQCILLVFSIWYFCTGTNACRHYININALAEKHGPAVCCATPLLPLLVMARKQDWHWFQRQAVVLPDRPWHYLVHHLMWVMPWWTCEQFVCQLYGSKACMSINVLRYEMFCLKASRSFQLPPTQDALRKHILRANYQTAIWMHALVAKPDLPGPNGHMVGMFLMASWSLTGRTNNLPQVSC